MKTNLKEQQVTIAEGRKDGLWVMNAFVAWIVVLVSSMCPDVKTHRIICFGDCRTPVKLEEKGCAHTRKSNF